MNCQAFEPLIALYVEGDQLAADTPRVQEHLAMCAACRELLDDLQASQAALKQLRAEPLDAALLAAVHSEVLASTHSSGNAVWPWVATAAAVAAALTAMLRPEPKPITIAQAPPPEVRLDAPVPAPRPVVTKPRRRPQRKAGPPLVVKMYTDDPNIVIIWLVDQTGD